MIGKFVPVETEVERDELTEIVKALVPRDWAVRIDRLANARQLQRADILREALRHYFKTLAVELEQAA